jgi:hypothetical protein
MTSLKLKKIYCRGLFTYLPVLTGELRNGRGMTQMASHWPFFTEHRIHFPLMSCGIYVVRTGSGTDLQLKKGFF